MRIAKSICLSALFLGVAGLASAGENQSYKVELNKTEILRLPGAAATVIVGNPETNLIILDNNGQTMLNADLQVTNTLPAHSIRIYAGGERETYSCIPFCGPSPVLGDSVQFVSQNTSSEANLAPTTAFSTPGATSQPITAAGDNTSFTETPGSTPFPN
jgi:hypothetical protein